METFGDWIKALRREHFATQEDFADAVGVHVRTVRRWEAGYAPMARHLKSIAAALGVSPIVLMDRVADRARLGPALVDYGREIGVMLLDLDNRDLRELLEPPPVGRRILRAMHWRDMDVSDLAKAVGLSPTTIERWLRNRIPNDPAKLQAVSDALDVPVWWLFVGYYAQMDLLGPSAQDVAVDRDDYFRLRAEMTYPDGWPHDQPKVNWDEVRSVAEASGLLAHDLARVMFPLASDRPTGSAGLLAWVLPDRIDAALDAVPNLPEGFVPRPRAEVFVAKVCDVGVEAIQAWAAGTNTPTVPQTWQLADAVSKPAWSFYAPRP